jgi:hypothetical protein
MQKGRTVNCALSVPMPLHNLKILCACDCVRFRRIAGSYWEPVWLICLVVIVLIALAGCRGAVQPSVKSPLSTRSTNSFTFPQEYAENIARREAVRVYGSRFDVDTPVLQENRYWRVVVESRGENSERSFTNFLFAEISRGEAEAITKAIARTKLGATNLLVRAAEFRKEPCWRVDVWARPAMPEGYFALEISARDGSLVRRFPEL